MNDEVSFWSGVKKANGNNLTTEQQLKFCEDFIQMLRTSPELAKIFFNTQVYNEIVNDVKKLPNVINSSYLGVSELDKETIKFLINTTCKQDDKWQVKRDVLKVVKTNFDKNKILLPYTKVEVINGKKV